MSIQTNQLINGQWVTRTVEIVDILENYQNMENAAREEAEKPKTRVPDPDLHRQFGILTRTVIPSPVVKWILPARVRRWDRSEFLFIGEDFVHLKELLSDRHVVHLATKSDFRSRIRAAAVFGQPPPSPPIKYNQNWDEETKRYKPDSPESPMEVDQRHLLPKQMLILCLASQEMVFLSAKDLDGSRVDITTTASIPLPNHHSTLEKIGNHIAVDPKSRAVAVASSQNSLLIFRAKDAATMQKEYDAKPRRWVPFNQERMVDFPGAILHLAFLYPKPDDDDHVILLLVTAKNGRAQICFWDWDHSTGLSSIRTSHQGHRLAREVGFPNCVIPLQQSAEFMLVPATGGMIYRYSDVLAGPPTVAPCKISVPQLNKTMWEVKGNIWSSWVRASRVPTWNKEGNEAFYIARDDGAFAYVQCLNGNLTASYAGSMGSDVDQAFAYLDLPKHDYSGPDVLIAAGNAGSGKIVKIGSYKGEDTVNQARVVVMEASSIGTVPSWTPSLDFAICPSPKSSFATGDSEPAAMFVTSGREPYGAISELRWGSEGHIVLSVEVGPELDNVTAVWSLVTGPSGATYFVLGFPEETAVLRLSPDSDEIENEFDESNCGIDLETETLAIASISKDQLVQVTPCSIHLLRPSQDESIMRTSSLDGSSLGRATVAVIHPSQPLILTARRLEGTTHVLVTEVVLENDSQPRLIDGVASSLDSEVTCAAFLDIRSCLHALVGLTDGTMRIFQVRQSDSTLHERSIIRMPGKASQSITACESVVFVSNRSDSGAGLLACGLRDGRLFSAELDADLTPKKTTVVTINQSPVKLYQPPHQPRIAFGVSEDTTFALSYSEDGDSGVQIASVWFTDTNRPDLPQPAVTALTRIPTFVDAVGSSLSGSLLCVSKGHLLAARVESTSNVVPRKIPIAGSPQKVHYSRPLKTLVVATISRDAASTLVCMEPDRTNDYEIEVGDERIYALADVEFTRDDKHYHLIAAGTGVLSPSSSRSGRLRLYKSKTAPDGKRRLRLSKTLNFPQEANDQLTGPVYSVESSTHRDLGHIIIGMEKCIVILKLNDDMKWERLVTHPLPSAATHITAEGQFINVSTSMDSLQTFFATEDGLQLISSDSSPRNSWQHLPFTLQTNSSTVSSSPSRPKIPLDLALLSDKERGLACLLCQHVHHGLTRISHAPLMTATLSRSIMRLRDGLVSPRWLQQPRPGVLVEHKLGSTADGTIFSINILDRPAHRLLSYLETLVQCDTQRPVDEGAWVALRKASDPDVYDQRLMASTHVNGDVLLNFLGRGAKARLEVRLVEAEERLQCGESTMIKLFKDVRASTPDHADIFGNEDVDGVLGWVRKVLAPVL